MKKYIIPILIAICLNSLCFADPSIFVSNYNDAQLLSQKINRPILLIFRADWCNHCDEMKEDLSLNLSVLDNTIVCYIDYDKNKQLIKNYKIKSVPTIVVLKDNKEISRKVGYKNIIDLTQWLENVK